MLITGDDILIEYVERLKGIIKQGVKVSEEHKDNIERFITHYVWHGKDKQDDEHLNLW